MVKEAIISKVLLFFRNTVRCESWFGSLTWYSRCYYEVDTGSVLLELHVTRWEYKEFIEKKSTDVNLKWSYNFSFVKRFSRHPLRDKDREWRWLLATQP